jgi:hypothetical protein
MQVGRVHPYWFGVQLEYVCSVCGKASLDLGVINSPTDDIETVRSRIDVEFLSCHSCKAPIRHGIGVDARIVPGTPEFLKNLGFPVPSVSPLQRRKGTDLG